ncbi:tetratricopeptide repeat protein [Aestuariicella hydrocarbonica]|uniref:Tetratricopeptide repeat protein n=1 Tax=Pseudomaricurvus hydrocarbonicus TaxID=1470433 RepID=A0A9E5T3N2_9GAMM|nr:tetratricopeptide repeat protein [Aestuariicella hydrocarbonica]NHO67144.1 tetratricopeptide repeat protein [Aestuariicella hydrocarbonica]
MALAGCASTDNKTTGDIDNSDLYQGSREVAYKSKTQNADASELNSEAQAALQSGNTDQAIFYLVQSLAKDPNQPEVYRRIGQIHLQLNHTALAQVAFERALLKAPDDLESLMGLGQIHLQQKHRDQAKSYFLQALAVDQQRFKPLLQPRSHMTNDASPPPLAADTPQPEDSVTEAHTDNQTPLPAKLLLRVDNRSPYPVYNNLGVLADLESNFAEAQKYYRLAIKIRPNTASAYNNLGYSHYLAGEWPEADIYYHQAIEQDPEFTQAWHNMGLLYVRMEKYQLAVDTFSRFMEDPEAYNTVGYLCMVSGKYKVAERYLKKAIDASPVYFAKARENLKQNRQYLENALAAKQSETTTN